MEGIGGWQEGREKKKGDQNEGNKKAEGQIAPFSFIFFLFVSAYKTPDVHEFMSVIYKSPKGRKPFGCRNFLREWLRED